MSYQQALAVLRLVRGKHSAGIFTLPVADVERIDALLEPGPADPMRPCCLDCGLPYVHFSLDVILPRPQWLEIHPAENGLLCVHCIVARAAKVPGATCCHMIIEVAPWKSIIPVEQLPSLQLSKPKPPTFDVISPSADGSHIVNAVAAGFVAGMLFALCLFGLLA